MIPKELRQTINQYAHAEGLRHEGEEKARLMASLAQLKAQGKKPGELQEWLDNTIYYSNPQHNPKAR